MKLNDKSIDLKPQSHVVNPDGFGLIELLVLIVVVGIMASIALQSMTALIKDARKTNTIREMEMLAQAITGDPSLMSGGVRSDFGYVGDVGAFPPDLQALYENPGGYTTWDGPYLPPSITQDSTGFTSDAWGAPYSYSGGITISSTGGGSAMARKIADASSDYLLNSVSGTVTDSGGNPPGSVYDDSVSIVIIIPNGAGSSLSKTYQPDSTGAFTLDSLPAGTHSLKIIYTPDVDTLHRYLTVLPRHKSSPSFRFAGGFGGGSGPLQMVPNSDSLYSSCSYLKLWITNTGASAVTVTSITLSWSSPTAYYQSVEWSGYEVVDEIPRIPSGQTENFSSSRTINPGSTIRLRFEVFRNTPTYGSSINMTNTDFTVLFSDGSTFSFTADLCY